ncbi:MAG: hypothetical protein ACQESF_02285 [Nanobdellota archaeon]
MKEIAFKGLCIFVMFFMLVCFVSAETPENGTVINKTDPLISWNITDNETINYTIKIGQSSDLSESGSEFNTTNSNYNCSILDDGIYYWKATGTNGNTTGINSFTVDTASPQFINWNTNPEDLKSSTSTDFSIEFELNESNLNGLPKCHYKFEDSDYNQWENTTLGEGSFSYSINENWKEHSEETLYYECLANDTVGYSTTSSERSDTIESNTEPEFVKLGDQYIEEDNVLRFTIDARDADGDDISFSCVNNEFNFTKINSTSSRVAWAPRNEDVGKNIVEFTISDGESSTSAESIITVNGTNDPPTLSEISDKSGYLHEPFKAIFTATDPDNENSASSDDQYVGFFSSDKRWLETGDELKFMFNGSNNKYTGLLNFTPLLSHKGRHNITIKVTDEGGLSDKQSFILDIGYCGDTDETGEPKCDSEYEDCESCPEDCGKCNVDDTNSMAIIIPNRNCLYANVTVSTYDLYERATCKDEGKIINGKEVCEKLDGVTIRLYKLEGNEWEKIDEFVTDTNGDVTFIPKQEGDYKIEGNLNEYEKAVEFVEFNRCIDVKENESENKTKQEEKETNPGTNSTSKSEDDKEKQPKEEQPSTPEKPGEKVEKTSTFGIILYFVIIPVLFACLIFLAFIYYQKEKNHTPWILKFRIWLIKKRKELVSLLQSIRNKLKEKLGF